MEVRREGDRESRGKEGLIEDPKVDNVSVDRFNQRIYLRSATIPSPGSLKVLSSAAAAALSQIHSCPVRSKLECKKKDANGNSKSRSEIGKTWHLLPIEEQAKFGQAADTEVVARNISGEQHDHESFVIPNNSDFPPTDEEIPGTTNHLGHEAETINIWWISDFGDQISISGDVPNLDFWKSKFPITSRVIFLKDIEHSLKEMTTTDDEFKVTLSLFLLGTILSPSANDYVQTGYLIPLRDVGTISLKNWSSW
ncbi:hypothetical protein LWI28_006632 [Acer negundo]|uniref:Uncharacterized protein n=1 Tax=Acer negundo TaxID=4023 RepID=A0AAD5I8P8_ACENE|nr:hypothetical protein LWI28_006632 [Acer negundo]